MGNDDSIRKRKAATDSDLKRQKPKRSPYSRVLIVCEDSVSAPKYFESIIDYYRLSSANVTVTGESDSSPDQVWYYARQLYDIEKKRNNPFDRVYCVIDRDEHTTFEKTCQSIRSTLPKNTFFAITSEPCFEYWLLLHFIYTTQPFYKSQRLSAAKQVEAMLKKYLTTYDKGQGITFESLIGYFETARKHGIRSLAEAEKNQNYNRPLAKVMNSSTFD